MRGKTSGSELRSSLRQSVWARLFLGSMWEHLASAPTLLQNRDVAFADLKNDFVFRRIFATHPDILRSLLNDLLERSGDQGIEVIEYLPSEQLPLVEGAKLSILDVRCRDRAGTTFVVEMQIIHMPGFINRVVYNACKAY